MTNIRLADFRNAWYRPGRNRFWQLGWFLIGSPLLRCSLIPFSSFRVALLRMFGASIGNGVNIKPGVQVKFPWRLKVGNDSWIGEGCWIDNLDEVELGNNVCVSQGAYFCTGNHDWSDPAFGLIVRPITIADGAWVGAKSVIAPGVRLAEGAVAGAGSVVVKAIPQYEIHSGNPAQFVRMREIRLAHLTDEILQETVAAS